MRLHITALTVLLLALVPAANSGVPVPGPGEGRMSVYSGGKRIGQSHYSVSRNGGHTEAVEKTSLRIKLLDNVQDVSTESRYILDGTEIESFKFVFDSPAGGMRADGEKDGDEFRIRTNTLSGAGVITFPSGGDPVPPLLLPQWILARSPETGKEYKVMLMDPLSIIAGAAPEDLESTHRIVSREKVDVPYLGSFDCWKVVSEISGSEVTMWITDGGEVVKQTMPPGLTAYLEAEGAGAPAAELEVFDITDIASIPSRVKLRDPRAVTYLRAGLSGIGPDDGFQLADGYRQSFDGKEIEVRAGDGAPADTYSIPYDGGEHMRHLAPDALVQSGDPRIVSRSREILGGEKDSLEAAALINGWVFRSLKKTGTASIPSALDVLETRAGDCNEHSVLFAAISRAAGIPTKTVSGTIYIDGRFYYHAWNEVYVGRWIAVDPTFGQLPADATHIKLTEGDLSESVRIMKAVGKINLDILEAS